MKSIAALLVLAVLLTGCEYTSKPSDLQQEKLVLDLMQNQRAQLAELLKKEHDDRALEKKNREAAEDIGRGHADLEKQQQEFAQNQKAAETLLAQEKAAMDAERCAAVRRGEIAAIARSAGCGRLRGTSPLSGPNYCR